MYSKYQRRTLLCPDNFLKKLELGLLGWSVSTITHTACQHLSVKEAPDNTNDLHRWAGSLWPRVGYKPHPLRVSLMCQSVLSLRRRLFASARVHSFMWIELAFFNLFARNFKLSGYKSHDHQDCDVSARTHTHGSSYTCGDITDIMLSLTVAEL